MRKGDRSERAGGRALSLILVIAAAALGLLAPASAPAADGTWERAWGKNVNGGGILGICTVAANCLTGTNGALGGEMSDPWGVATDAAGNVYVADRVNNRIQKFSSSGVWERAWGKAVNGGGIFGVCTVAANCQAGTTGGLGGEMNDPTGVATDAAGNVYVADNGNNRIQKFSSSGVWERAWGRNVNGGSIFGVCTVAPNCLAGTTGGLGGEMDTPTAVATDAAGNVYVADGANNRIQKFNSSGVWDRAWGKSVAGGANFEVCTAAASCLAGTTGGLGGEMDTPTAVATDAAGNVYVADTVNDRIQKFIPSGLWERAWGKNVNGGGSFEVCIVAASCLTGTIGGLGGEMISPAAVATDAAGNVYVGDNYRIQKFSSSGIWGRAWGKNVNGGGVFGVCTVAANCLAGTFGGLGGEMSDPYGVATDAAGNVYVADSGSNRVQRFADPAPPPPPPTGATPTPPAKKKCKKGRKLKKGKCVKKKKRKKK